MGVNQIEELGLRWAEGNGASERGNGICKGPVAGRPDVQCNFIEILQQHPKRKHLILLMRKLGFQKVSQVPGIPRSILSPWGFPEDSP